MPCPHCNANKTVIKMDNDGHRFEVPVELEARFNELFEFYIQQEWLSEAYYDAEAAFCNEFEQYMIG